MDNRKISICIPAWNRTNMVIEAFEQVHDDPRVDEVVIVDDASDMEVYEWLFQHLARYDKVFLSRNKENLDCYFNKARALRLAKNDYCIILDSDNSIDKTYLDTIYEYEWNEKTAFMPSFANPQFDYRSFSDLVITKENVATYFDMPLFETMLNCMNYFVPRSFYLSIFDENTNPHTADSLYQNYNWLINGGSIFVVPNLLYMHRIHASSHYILNNHKTVNFHEDLKNLYRKLK